MLCFRWHSANYLMCCDTWSWPGWLRPIFRVPSAMLRWRSRRRPALTFTHDVSVTTETRGPDTEPVGYEPVTREHTEDIQTAVCRAARLGAAPRIFCKAQRYQDNLTSCGHIFSEDGLFWAHQVSFPSSKINISWEQNVLLCHYLTTFAEVQKFIV